MINVFHIVSNKAWGGAERYASDLVAHMRHDPNFYVEVVSAKHDDIIEQFQKMDIPVSILPLKGNARMPSLTKCSANSRVVRVRDT